jgi:hypothetical protein
MDTRRLVALFSVLAGFSLMGCSELQGNETAQQKSPSDTSASDLDTRTGDDIGRDSSESDGSGLGCKSEKYPCKISEEEESIRTSNVNHAADAFERLISDGAESAADLLESKRSVEGVSASNGAIRFRQADGRPVWLVKQPERKEPANVNRTNSLKVRSQGLTEFGKDKAELVASRSRRSRDQKSALAVVPYPQLSSREETGADSAAAIEITSVLEETAGYSAENITRIVGEQVSFSDFSDWSSYDVILVDSITACVGEDTRGCEHLAVAVGEPISGTVELIQYENDSGELVEPPESKRDEWETSRREFEAAKGSARSALRRLSNYGFRKTGLSLMLHYNCEARDLDETNLVKRTCQLTWDLALGRDFVSQEYGESELESHLVLLNGGRTVGRADGNLAKFLSRRMQYVGWRKFPGISPAKSLLTETFREMAKTGLGLETALDQNSDDQTTASQLVGSNTRLRELPSMETPEGHKLQSSDIATALIGGIPGDGEPDTLTLDVRVDGIVPDRANSFEVFLRVNGQQVTDAKKVGAKGEKRGDYTYLVPFESVDLEEDIPAEEPFSLSAVVRLPDDTLSLQKLDDLKTRICRVSVDFPPVGGPLTGSGSTAAALGRDSAGFLAWSSRDYPDSQLAGTDLTMLDIRVEKTGLMESRGGDVSVKVITKKEGSSSEKTQEWIPCEGSGDGACGMDEQISPNGSLSLSRAGRLGDAILFDGSLDATVSKTAQPNSENGSNVVNTASLTAEFLTVGAIDPSGEGDTLDLPCSN